MLPKAIIFGPMYIMVTTMAKDKTRCKDGRLHPWRVFAEGALKRPPAPVPGRETLKGISKLNRAR